MPKLIEVAQEMLDEMTSEVAEALGKDERDLYVEDVLDNLQKIRELMWSRQEKGAVSTEEMYEACLAMYLANEHKLPLLAILGRLAGEPSYQPIFMTAFGAGVDLGMRYCRAQAEETCQRVEGEEPSE